MPAAARATASLPLEGTQGCIRQSTACAIEVFQQPQSTEHSCLQVAQLQQECSALELLVNKLEAQLRRETGRKTASPLQQSQPAVAHSIDLVGMQGVSMAFLLHTCTHALPADDFACSSGRTIGARACSYPRQECRG